MDNLSLHYLQAMNIPVWQLRKSARLLVITEELCAGDSLLLLQEMLFAMNMDQHEIDIQKPLAQKIKYMEPLAMLVLGITPARSLLNTDQSLNQLRGKVHYYGDKKIPMVVTHCPTDLLKTPMNKADVMRDLLIFIRDI